MGRRITIAHCVFNLARAGAQYVVHRLVVGRDRARFDAIVYAFHDGPLAEDLRACGATVRILRQHFPFLDPTLVGRLYGFLRRDEVDVVHTHLFGADLHGGLAAWAAGLPALTTVHSDRPDNRRQKLLAGMVFRLFGRVVPVGDRVSASVISRCPEVASKLLVIRNGVEDPLEAGGSREALRRILGVPDGEALIGTVGRLVPEKAHFDLIEAFRMVTGEEPSVRLVILGEGPLREHLEATASRHGLSSRVHFLGSLPGAARLMAGLDVFALCSLREGLPLSLLEAMAAGLPCVASRVGSIEEVVQDGVTGRLLAPSQPGRLAAVILELLRNPDERSAMGRRAREAVLKEYNAATMVAAYERIYVSLAASRIVRQSP